VDGRQYIEMFVGGSGTNTTATCYRCLKNSFIVSIRADGVRGVHHVAFRLRVRAAGLQGRQRIFWTLMYMSMFPNVVAILPLIPHLQRPGWINNLNALIWPAMAGVFNIFLIRNF
jgi:multiple sugar transport system permease protein